MRCKIQLLDENGKSWFEAARELPGEEVLKFAVKRKPMLEDGGTEFAQGAVPAFGGELVKVVKARGTEDEIDKAVIELVVITIAVESVFGASDDELLKRDISLVVHHNGAVQYDRLNIQPT